jgi:sugar phosphate permease
MASMRIFRGWGVVFGAGVGLAFGTTVFTTAGFSQLAQAWAADFGWTQAELAKAATLFLLMQALSYPFMGHLATRWGSRNFACASIGCFGMALLLMSRISNSLLQLYAICALMGLVCSGTNVVGYANAISLWFDRRRGLAFGLAASAQAVGNVLMPLMTVRLLGSVGWSGALLSLAAVELLVCLPVVAAMVRDSPQPYGVSADGARASGAGPRPTAAAPAAPQVELLRSRVFWQLILAYAVMGIVTYAFVINVVFVLAQTARMSVAEVASAQAVVGASVLLGRIGFGHLMDKLGSARSGMLVSLLLGAAFVVFATCSARSLVLLAGLMFGVAGGGESDLLPYTASRYFGAGATAKVFGWFLAAFLFGGAIGPLLFAAIMASRSAVVGLFVLAALMLLPLAVFASLRRAGSSTLAPALQA